MAEVDTPTKPNEEGYVTINIQPLLTPISIVIAGILISASILVGLRGVSVNASTGTTTTAQQPTGVAAITNDQLAQIFSGDYIKFGDQNSKVKLVEFSDPSCPYCHIAGGKNPSLNSSVGATFKLVSDGGTYVAPVPEFKKLVEEGKAAYAYIFTTGHGNGELGMQALYCAQDQSKFWAVHDKLFTSEGYDLLNDVVKNDTKNSGKLADFLAKEIDKNYLKECLESGKYASRVRSDETFARSLGVSGTPGFFVNTTSFSGAYNFTEMQPTIESALAK